MISLTGMNLGERQKELNLIVNSARQTNVKFDEIKDKPEATDVDKLFKIDLASKYKNIDYIIDMLKSGDTLYISRALKCEWMYGLEFSHIINVDYLHHNVFPSMSLKMKKKLLTTVSIHVRNPDRALAFYKYCIDAKLTNMALKFVIFTSDVFKLEFLKENSGLLNELRYKNDFKHFIGSSFTLADAHLSTVFSDSTKVKVFYEINHLFSVSNVKYLDLLEKHIEQTEYNNQIRLGLRISKDIFAKYKERVIRRPEVYINFINKTCTIKYSTPDNAKTYIPALLPSKVSDFWNQNFCFNYEYIFNIIPAEERFGFIKKVFNEKYPDHPFEMDIKFYEKGYHKFMTLKQKDKWALEQIASEREILGIGKDYVWYKYVNFDTAFEEAKKITMLTPDNNKRAEIINILVQSAKTERDLEKLFRYLHDRHNNEQRYIKENFVDLVTYNHNVYKFDKDCWAAFDKILQNLDVYSMIDFKCKGDYKIVALIYHIINKMDVHDALKIYINSNMYFYTLKLNTDKLTKEQVEMVFEYLFKHYMDIINGFDADTERYQTEGRYQMRKYIYFILDLLHLYDRTKEDIPEVVGKYMKLDWDEFKCHKLHYIAPIIRATTQEDLIGFLKKDANLTLVNLPLVKKNIEICYRFHLGQLLKKIKVYFPNDIAKEYVKFYKVLLQEPDLHPKVARAAVYGLFQLTDEKFRVDFMMKYVPIQSKINRGEIDERMLYIQEAICATAFYARPPVPLKNMLLYIKGDYVQFCLPMFNSYLANLPLPHCIQFVEAILNTPLSIQKHGLRLAFACFNAENLKKIVLHIWKKTKNVSLRLIIYKALYNKVTFEGQNVPTALFETLTMLTLELNQDDDNELFSILTSGKLPRHLISDYISTVWATVSALPKKSLNLKRMIDVIGHINSRIELIRQDVIRPIVKEFIKSAFDAEELNVSNLSAEAKKLRQQKWDLTIKHITNVQNEDDLEIKIELIKIILNECFSRLNLVVGDKYVVRFLLMDIINNLRNNRDSKNKYLVEIFENVLQTLLGSVSIEEIYLLVWILRMDIIAFKAVTEVNSKLENIEDAAEKSVIVREVLLKFSKEIANLFTEFIDKDMYFKTFVPAIQEALIEKMSDIADMLEYSIRACDVIVLTCCNLLESKTTEMYSLALRILPTEYEGVYDEEYKSVLREIFEQNNSELKCEIFAKFVYTNFRRIEYLQL